MKLAIVSFTRNGCALGKQIKQQLPDALFDVFLYTKSKHVKDTSVVSIESDIKTWTGQRFEDMGGILFIGACGIAVRSIGPYLKGKEKDPAVLVLDEQGKFCISLISGHIGGANELTSTISSIVGGIPVITTGTDVNNLFAVDTFATKNNLFISNIKLVKEISGRLIDGDEVDLFCIDGKITNMKQEGITVLSELTSYKFQKQNQIAKRVIALCIKREDKKVLPEEAQNHVKDISKVDILVGLPFISEEFNNPLYLIPRVITLGIGCKKDTNIEAIKSLVSEAIVDLCERYKLDKNLIYKAVKQVASVDLKKNERGLVDYCHELGVPFCTYTPEQLRLAKGTFTSSKFVKKVTTVDNVCERAAVYGGNQGTLIYKKRAMDGVTIAMAVEEWSVDFE